ncbi:hypothetical protein, unlikely [Trypanosoma brucei gambiense DAL972]|uniref:Uncharacterized protein n=1 Tax=Trypanosoma brucei gambiense (strain MHOM/CI/86/DAL972) TaxID=679716 RepID=C9ZKE4_TRYB9|nr:hypothetical protein, unlikely [Trypanosoma brucei gambiense DAL972]CBH09908.1 hypothetical protein, unlikely [Trypanosoma brucei gambiense DAL972]|eukprot:XP_011772201.1 hypothetical protein, unlikely [Trypanosoma brucei gambiense DAL972]
MLELIKRNFRLAVESDVDAFLHPPGGGSYIFSDKNVDPLKVLKTSFFIFLSIFFSICYFCYCYCCCCFSPIIGACLASFHHSHHILCCFHLFPHTYFTSLSSFFFILLFFSPSACVWFALRVGKKIK